MKHSYLKVYTLIVFVIIIMGSCKEDPIGFEPISQKFYYSSTEYNPTTIIYSSDFIKSLVGNVAPELSSYITHDAKLFIVKYKTEFEGDTIIASGLVATPVAKSDNEKFPILSFQHGTEAQLSKAPTVTVEGGNINSIPSYLACAGMIVAIPDYIGFGSTSDNFHPYMHKQYTNNAVLDLIRATKEFINLEEICHQNDKLFLMGYSQGATATMSALEAIETVPANADIEVTAASCGGGVYDLNKMVDRILKNDFYEQPFYLSYITESYSKYTSFDVDYSDIYHEDIVDIIPGIIDGIKSGAEINAEIGETAISRVFTYNFKNNYLTDDIYQSMRDVMAENSIQPWDLKTQVKIFHGEKDVWVYPDQPQLLKANFNNAGFPIDKISVKTLDNLDHTGAIYPSITDGIKWFKTLY